MDRVIVSVVARNDPNTHQMPVFCLKLFLWVITATHNADAEGPALPRRAFDNSGISRRQSYDILMRIINKREELQIGLVAT